MSNAYPDPVIDEVRAERARISALCNNDPVQLVAYLQRLEEQHRGRLLETTRKSTPAIPESYPIDTIPAPAEHIR